MEKSATKLTTGQRKMLGDMFEKLRRGSEDRLKGDAASGNKVTVTAIADKRGTLTAEFRTNGKDLVLKSSEPAERRHAFARLIYDVADSSCTVRICPAVVHGIDLSGPHFLAGPHFQEIDARNEDKLDIWRSFFGEVLSKPGIKQIEIDFGNLRDIPFRPTACQCHSNE